MAYFYEEPSRTFGEYLLVPGYSSAENVPTAVSLKTPLVKYRKGQEECPLQMNIPMISAIMQSVSGDKLAIALARQGGVSFIYGSQSIENEAAMVRRVKSFKAGYVVSDSNLAPTATLHDVLELKARTGHSTIAITADGTPNGKLLGIVASRDYRINHTPDDACVTTFMTPVEKLVTAPANTSLHDCNNIIWDNKINTLPLVDAEGNLVYMVFRKDYDSHKANVNELLDKNKSYVVGAGINTRDYAQRVPALVEAGVDVLCIDSSEGYSEWQSRTIGWIREHYGDPRLSLNMITEHLAISTSYFSAIFKSRTGATFVEYLTRVRMEKAQQILAFTDRRTYEAAEDVGFSDPHYFSVTFKRVTGLTPKEYREFSRRGDTAPQA